MPTNKERITANLDTEDYQWIDEKAELTGNSRAGVIRQIVRGLRLRKPGLLDFGDAELVFREEPVHTRDEGIEAEDKKDVDVTEEGDLEAINSK
jgi:hypothetical protein